jgi:hypothetical protein
VTGTNLHTDKCPGTLVVGEIRKRGKGGCEAERTTNQLVLIRTVMARMGEGGEGSMTKLWYVAKNSRRMSLGSVPHDTLHRLPLMGAQEERPCERYVQLTKTRYGF